MAKYYKVTYNGTIIDDGLSYREACELATKVDNDPRYFRGEVDVEPMED